MRRLKKDSVKRVLRIILFVITVGFGLIGYYFYYHYCKENDNIGLAISQTIYSTIRLFGASFDFNYQDVSSNYPRILVIGLEIARWSAIFLTGNVVFNLLRPVFFKLKIAIDSARWERQQTQVLIVGNNAQNRMLYRSVPKEENAAIVAYSIEECQALAAEGIRSVLIKHAKSEDDSVRLKATEKRLVQLLTEAAKCHKQFTVVIHTGEEKDNIYLCEKLKNCIYCLVGNVQKDFEAAGKDVQQVAMQKKEEFVEVLKSLRIYAFGERKHKSVYYDIESATGGIVKFVNAYQAIGYEFAKEHGFLEHMDKDMFQKHVHNACLSEELTLNMVFLGFGETNMEILSTYFATNQFVQQTPGNIPQLKKVNYFIFDKQANIKDKSLSDTLFRYQEEFLAAIEEGSLKKEDYFEISDFPANIRFETMDVFDEGFYRKLKAIHTASTDSITQVVICIGSDLENLDLAKKLAGRKTAWGAEHLYIYAKARNEHSVQIGREIDADAYQLFGNEEALVFDYNALRQNDLEKIALKRHIIYYLEKNNAALAAPDKKRAEVDAMYDWYIKLPNHKRLSNLMCILSLRTKLQLMGLDYYPGKVEDAHAHIVKTNEDYFHLYAAACLSQFSSQEMQQIKRNCYLSGFMYPQEEYLKNLLRHNLTIQEHLRWNAFMISCGFVPLDKETVLRSNKSQNYACRKHGNLCTFEGLFDFRKETAQHHHCDEKAADVIKYDYELMDNAWWFLNDIGYDIYFTHNDKEEI